MNVSVSDSSGGAAINTATVVAKSRTESYADSTKSAFNGVYALAYEHAGTYDITVTAPGYRLFSLGGIVVTRDACHVLPVVVTVRLGKG